MLHDVATVARTNGIPEADLVDFAISRDLKYSIIMKQGIARISTWHVDALIADFEREREEDAAIMAHPMAQPAFDAGCEIDPASEKV